MISINNVSKWYFGETPVLSRIQLKIERGEFLYVLGGSGAGKSSLLRILATEEYPSSGGVELFGYHLHQANPSTLRSIRQAIGYIPQDVRLIPDLTVYENIALSLSLAGPKASVGATARAKVQDAMERTGLTHLSQKNAADLSGGEAQRVAIARAWVRKPDLIIADEPTGSQDRDHTWSIMNLLMSSNSSGTGVIVATHDREIIRRVRKKCAVLKGGSLSMEDSLCIY